MTKLTDLKAMPLSRDLLKASLWISGPVQGWQQNFGRQLQIVQETDTRGKIRPKVHVHMASVVRVYTLLGMHMLFHQSVHMLQLLQP